MLLGSVAASATTDAVAAEVPACRAPADDSDAAGSRSGPVAVRVRILKPVAGESASGIVRVEGSASSVQPLSRVELVVAGTVVDGQDFEPTTTMSFNLSWDPRRGQVGRNSLKVEACGASAHGESSVDVTIPRRRPLWIGLVVGLAGLGGLAFSSAFRLPSVSRASRRDTDRLGRPGDDSPTG